MHSKTVQLTALSHSIRYGEAVGYMADQLMLRGIKFVIVPRVQDSSSAHLSADQEQATKTIDTTLDLFNMLYHMEPHMTSLDKSIVLEILTKE